MNYIKVVPQAGLTSAQRTEAISYELWAISRPPAVRNPEDVTAYIFGWVTRPDGGDPAYLPEIVDTALIVDPDYTIVVSPENNLTALITLFPELSQEEKDALAAYIESQHSFPFRNIVPSTVTLFTKEEMTQAGWFADQAQILS